MELVVASCSRTRVLIRSLVIQWSTVIRPGSHFMTYEYLVMMHGPALSHGDFNTCGDSCVLLEFGDHREPC